MSLIEGFPGRGGRGDVIEVSRNQEIKKSRNQEIKKGRKEGEDGKFPERAPRPINRN